ncbi:NAD-dependent epimerase/dehydratase family protein [Streptomyces sindenensis]|uniref:NAD-dependent epimerase/dehydratase family protein n=1 Tax=Streptomyces sindenensis TaxID=67363 RepID=A0ABW6ES79_9ACTN
MRLGIHDHSEDLVDYVIHAAARTREPADAIDVNIAGAKAVLDAVAASHRVRRLVVFSSASVYGDGEAEEAESRDLVAMRQLLESVHGRVPRPFHEFDPGSGGVGWGRVVGRG